MPSRATVRWNFRPRIGGGRDAEGAAARRIGLLAVAVRFGVRPATSASGGRGSDRAGVSLGPFGCAQDRPPGCRLAGGSRPADVVALVRLTAPVVSTFSLICMKLRQRLYSVICSGRWFITL